MLNKIAIFKALDVEVKKQRGPHSQKESYKGHHSLKEELSQAGISIIAEVMAGNPERGLVRQHYRPTTLAKSFQENGAHLLCVATDRFLFYGEDKHLSDMRPHIKMPILRNDFIFEDYQVEESKILGADAIYLMVSLLSQDRLISLLKAANAKGLDVVMQVNSEEDITRALATGADMLCVLGRDLSTWRPDYERALELLRLIPPSCIRIVEAGIQNFTAVQELEEMGIHGVVLGDVLLDDFYPGKRLAQLLSGVEPTKRIVKGRGKGHLAEEAEEVVASDELDLITPPDAEVLPEPILKPKKTKKSKVTEAPGIEEAAVLPASETQEAALSEVTPVPVPAEEAAVLPKPKKAKKSKLAKEPLPEGTPEVPVAEAPEATPLEATSVSEPPEEAAVLPKPKKAKKSKLAKEPVTEGTPEAPVAETPEVAPLEATPVPEPTKEGAAAPKPKKAKKPKVTETTTGENPELTPAESAPVSEPVEEGAVLSKPKKAKKAKARDLSPSSEPSLDTHELPGSRAENLTEGSSVEIGK